MKTDPLVIMATSALMAHVVKGIKDSIISAPIIFRKKDITVLCQPSLVNIVKSPSLVFHSETRILNYAYAYLDPGKYKALYTYSDIKGSLVYKNGRFVHVNESITVRRNKTNE